MSIFTFVLFFPSLNLTFAYILLGNLLSGLPDETECTVVMDPTSSLLVVPSVSATSCIWRLPCFFHTDTFKMAFDAAVVAYRVLGWAFCPFRGCPHSCNTIPCSVCLICHLYAVVVLVPCTWVCCRLMQCFLRCMLICGVPHGWLRELLIVVRFVVLAFSSADLHFPLS